MSASSYPGQGRLGNTRGGVNVTEHGTRTLVVVLSMHRSGSSVTTSILQRLGMSLGPFELVGAAPSNPYGHFESEPFVELDIQVEEALLGFPDDLHQSEDVLENYIKSDGRLDPDAAIPQGLLGRGRELIAALIDSGQVSGFKDPRTPVVWPFWRRVLEFFPSVRVVPLLLLRSPHEIAMSLCSRRPGLVAYWDSMDLIAIHLRRAREIIESWGEPAPTVRFGGPFYLSDLAAAATHCGLVWDPDKAQAQIDRSCIRQLPARVRHEAQAIYDDLHGAGDSLDPAANEARLVVDLGRCERMLRHRIYECNDQARSDSSWMKQLQNQLDRAHGHITNLNGEINRLNGEIGHLNGEVKRLKTTISRLEWRRRSDHSEMERLTSDSDWLRQSCTELADELSQYCIDALAAPRRVALAVADWQGSVFRTDQPDDQAAKDIEEFQQLINAAQDSLLRCAHQQRQLEKFERHFLIGPALRFRRWLKKSLAALAVSARGESAGAHRFNATAARGPLVRPAARYSTGARQEKVHAGPN
jgi:hypothetical protein